MFSLSLHVLSFLLLSDVLHFLVQIFLHILSEDKDADPDPSIVDACLEILHPKLFNFL